MDALLRTLDRQARAGDRRALAELLAWHLRLGVLTVTLPEWAASWGWEPVRRPGKRSGQRAARRDARAQRQAAAEDRADQLRRRAPIRYERRGERPSKRRRKADRAGASVPCCGAAG